MLLGFVWCCVVVLWCGDIHGVVSLASGGGGCRIVHVDKMA